MARGLGTLVGFAVGGSWGALIGGFLEQVFFPPEGPKGPRLNELNVQRSTVGAPIQIRYGTAAGAGNIIWSGGLLETKHEDEQGGFLGIGGVTTTSYTYSADFAVGICAGEDGSPCQPAGIRRIWAGPELIYDASDDATLTERLELGGTSLSDLADFLAGIRAMSAQLDFTFYDGSEDQLPDPTIESYEPAGTVPAFRGLAYVVFNSFDLTPYGNQIPNIRIETYSGTPTECGLYSAGNLHPWAYATDASVRDPRNLDNTHTYVYTEGGDPVRATLAEALADMEASAGRSFLMGAVPNAGDSIYIHGWSNSTTPNNVRPCDTGQPLSDYVTVQVNLNSLHNIDHVCESDPGVGFTCAAYETWLPAYDTARHLSAGQLSGYYGRSIDDSFNWGEQGLVSTGGTECTPVWLGFKFSLEDRQLGITRSILPPDPCLYGTALAGAPGYCTVNGQITQGITWTQVAGTFHVLQAYDTDGGNLVTAYPVGPAVISTDPLYNDQDYWEAAYADALAAGEPIAGGLTYGVDYPETQSFAYFSECATVDTECVPMATIVADICRRAGLRTDTATQIDVSGLSTCVNGYIIGRQMSARDALGPLRMFGLWDATESQGLLRFVERGAAIVESLTSDDLGAHENGSQPPSAVEVARVQEKDLPRRLRLHFANFLHDHEVSEQSASRISTEAITELDVDLPISMEPDTAAQLADVMLYAEWYGRSTYRFALDNNWLHLEPTDCIEIPVDGQTERVRIVAVNYKIGGILEIDAQRDDDGAYVSTAVADPSAPSGGVPGGPGSGPICPSGIVLLDIPRLNTLHIDAGYYAAIYSTCPAADSWACAELYRSNDGGVTYGRVARTNAETTVGEIDSITGPATDPTLPGESPAYDTTSTITVTLFEGTLASITDAQIAAGQNMAAVGLDGRWVIIQFKTATLDTGDTWTLTDLIWGLNETQHLLYTTVAGDSFVLLSDADLLRIPESSDAIGVSKSFKVLTCGEAIDAVTAFDFTTWGLSYRRTCPSSVISATLTTPPSGATDGDAYLLPNDTALTDEWADHGGEVAHWSEETESWLYCTPVPGTIIIIGVDSSSDPGDGAVISDGDGNYNPAPWTPAIPPLIEATPADSDYFVFHDGTGYKKGLLSEIAGGALDTSGDVDLALDQLSDVTITAATPGDVLTYSGTAGWTNEAPTGGVGWAFVAQATVVGSAATSLQVSGLDLDTDEIYFIEVSFDNTSASAIDISLFFNADTTTTNYHRQAFAANSTTLSGARANDADICAVAGTQTCTFSFEVSRDVNGHTRARSNLQARGDTTGIIMQAYVVHWPTVANVTTITLTSTIATSLAVDSYMRIWRIHT